jgi:cytochrome b561
MVKYPLSMRIFHWMIAVLIIGMLACGLIMEELAHGNPAACFSACINPLA